MSSNPTRQQPNGQYYRTFVRGRLVQQSALVAGGSDPEPGGADIACARDGAGRLVIPGTGLAGALIETAGRIRPELLASGLRSRPIPLKRVTAKTTETLAAGQQENQLLQSVVLVYPAHRLADVQPTQPNNERPNETELRQGVGIRQATGTTAAERKALFDMEVIPAGTEWEFFLEIDTLRGGPEVERLILLAVLEWAAGRCWLGANAARGTGWIELEDVQGLRLPLSEAAIDAWPNNRFESCEAMWSAFSKLEGAQTAHGTDAIRGWVNEAESPALLDNRFWYVTIAAELCAGVAENGYGLDSVSVGGHTAGLLAPLSQNLLAPNGLNADQFRDQYNPDAPVVVTKPQGGEGQAQPFLPGSGLRGPLRHATSRWLRGLPQASEQIPDPNDPAWEITEHSDDPVSQLFGLTTRCARLLIRDGMLVRDPSNGSDGQPPYRLALFEHHAEDEFAGGVYGSGKFDRTAVIEGTFQVRLVIEAPTRDELMQHLRTLAPTLRLGELGHLPIGGGKWRGFGWVPWRFTSVEVWQAGDSEPKPPRHLRNPQRQNNWIAQAIAELTRD